MNRSDIQAEVAKLLKDAPDSPHDDRMLAIVDRWLRLLELRQAAELGGLEHEPLTTGAYAAEPAGIADPLNELDVHDQVRLFGTVWRVVDINCPTIDLEYTTRGPIGTITETLTVDAEMRSLWDTAELIPEATPTSAA